MGELMLVTSGWAEWCEKVEQMGRSAMRQWPMEGDTLASPPLWNIHIFGSRYLFLVTEPGSDLHHAAWLLEVIEISSTEQNQFIHKHFPHVIFFLNLFIF